MKMVWRGAAVVAAAVICAGCGEGPGVGMTSADWDMLYQAQLTREKALAIAAQSAQIWRDSQASRRRIEAGRAEVDQLTREGNDVLAVAHDCKPGDKDALCTASMPMPDQLKALKANQTAVQSAAAAFQTEYDGVVQRYADARAPWNAWLHTVILVLADDDSVTSWSGFRKNEQIAIAAGQAFVGATPEDAPTRALRARQTDLQAALSAYDSSVQALARSVLTARGQIESTATVIAVQGPIPSQPTGAAAAAGGGGAISFDPTQFISQFITLWGQFEQQRAQRAAQVREKLIGQLETFMWPEYSCFTTPAPGCPGYPAGRASAPAGGARASH
ncbi:MAG TPA: hypothetical protein VFL28_04155 [bacterium]|nr:hypothetical protein [bacterium]